MRDVTPEEILKTGTVFGLAWLAVGVYLLLRA